MSELPNFANYNIALVPGENVSHRAVDASEQINAASTSEFVLDNENFFAHITVFMIRLKMDRLEQAKTAIGQIAAQTREFILEPVKYVQSRGYIYVSYDKPDVLETLQEDIVEQLSPLRSGLTPVARKRLKVAEAEERELIESYGFGNVGDLYKPHMTFAKTKDEQRVELALCLSVPPAFRGMFSSLALFRMGEYGTCVEEVENFQLGEGVK